MDLNRKAIEVICRFGKEIIRYAGICNFIGLMDWKQEIWEVHRKIYTFLLWVSFFRVFNFNKNDLTYLFRVGINNYNHFLNIVYRNLMYYVNLYNEDKSCYIFNNIINFKKNQSIVNNIKLKSNEITSNAQESHWDFLIYYLEFSI